MDIDIAKHKIKIWILILPNELFSCIFYVLTSAKFD